jgi:hypothetical protein
MTEAATGQAAPKIDRKAVMDLLARLKGCIASLEGEAIRAEAAAAVPPTVPPLSEDEAAQVKRLVEETSGLVKGLEDMVTPKKAAGPDTASGQGLHQEAHAGKK